MTLEIGMLLFPRVQQLDLTGPYEVFAALPDARMHLVAQSVKPVTTVSGLILTPTTIFADCPPLDLLCIPGGAGVDALLGDERTIEFVRRQAAGVRYLTSVCTGALVLGAAGLLKGKRATTHWNSHHLLADFGAIPVHGRVVRDGDLITAGGVTAGIDFALTLAAELVGPLEAQAIQLNLEYAPGPPFDAGSPETASPEVLALVRARSAKSRASRERLTAPFRGRYET